MSARIAALGRAVAAFAQLPGAIMLVVIVLCLAAREWYPLTPFPMYATFSVQSWYVCLTDDHDRLVATQPTFGTLARPLRRIFETGVLTRVAAGEPRAAAEQHAAGDVLHFVLHEAAAAQRPLPPALRLRLRRVTSSIVDQHLERTHESFGEVGTE